MEFVWSESCRAFNEAGAWFVQTVAEAAGRWDEPGLGEWDIRSLVGHTSRSFLTVESYLAKPAATVEVASAADYYRAVRSMAAGPQVAARGREAGAALGTSPPAAVAEIAERVIELLTTKHGEELMTTAAGGMRLADYLPTRTFELTVHTIDLASAIGGRTEPPKAAAAQALRIVGQLAVEDELAGQLLLAATGRTGLPTGFSVL